MKSFDPASRKPDFGLVAWLEQTRVVLPLKGVECWFRVTGAIASVELDQIYHQDNARPLDCTYTFPLPAGAAAYRCELHVNGRTIRARVEERAAAQRIFQAQKAAGRRAALVETERENLFTLSLGNVQPGDLIVVRFAWFQVLDRVGGGLRLTVPTCPGVRYIPGRPLLRAPVGSGTADDTDQVPDASRLSPPRIDALHPDAAYFSLEGQLVSGDVGSRTVSSPSHPLLVRENAGLIAVEFAGRDAVPDRDFVLVWREPSAQSLAPQAWRWAGAGESYALLQLRAPETATVADDFAQDFYFLLDRSGSMQGVKWTRSCEALRAFVALLGPNDRVAITLFESEFLDFAEAPLPASRVAADPGFRRMESLGTAGGTELLPAAEHVLARIAAHSAGRRTSVILITDGQVGNEAPITRAFAAAPHVIVHTFGIDTAVNDAFLKSLAEQQRGGCWLQTPNDDIAGTIAALGARLRRPVLTGLSLPPAWESGRARLPDLHAGEVVTIAVRQNGPAAGAALEIGGRLVDGTPHALAVSLADTGSEAIKLLWVRDRMAACLAAGRQAEAIALAKQHNLICEGAAFIAWDETEQVPLATDELVQPAFDVQFATVGAAAAPCVAAPKITRGGDMLRYRSYMQKSTPVHDPLADEDAEKPKFRSADVARRLASVRTALASISLPPGYAEELLLEAQAKALPERVRELERAVELLGMLRSDVESPAARDFLAASLRQLLGDSPRGLLSRANLLRPLVGQVVYLLKALSERGASPAVLEHLAGWLLVSGLPDADRIERLRLFVEAFGRLPFSTASAVGHWQAFLTPILDPNSATSIRAQDWLNELERPAPQPS